MASELKPLALLNFGKRCRNQTLASACRKMYGVGKKTACLLHQMGIQTIGELARYDRKQLVKALGKHGNEIYLHANGHDTSTIKPNTAKDMKSIGRSTTLPQDISDIEKAKLILLELSEDVGMTARKYEKKGRTVQITLKYTDFKVITRQTTISPTCSTNDIYLAGCNLLEKNWNRLRPVRLIGISISDLRNCTEGQLSLFDLLDNDILEDNIKNKFERIDKA